MRHAPSVRQDLLNEVVWTEVIRLLEEPALIQQELDRRLVAAQAADPTRTRTQAVERDLARVGKGHGTVVSPRIRRSWYRSSSYASACRCCVQREQTLRQQLSAVVEQTRDRAAHLRLAETLAAFLTRLRATADPRSTSSSSNESCASSSRKCSSATT